MGICFHDSAAVIQVLEKELAAVDFDVFHKLETILRKHLSRTFWV